MRSQVISKHKIALIAVILVVAAELSVPQAVAGGDAARGEMLGDTCLSCHASEDYRNADPVYRAPKLGGQKASYLLVALKAYRDGTRQDPVMAPLVSTLSDDTVALLSKYFSSLEGLWTTEVK